MAKKIKPKSTWVKYETCPTCNGSGLKKDPTGNFEIDDPCDDCWGEGKVEKEITQPVLQASKRDGRRAD